MSPNRPSLAQAVQMSVTEVAELPIDILAILHEEASELKSHAKRCDDHLYSAMRLRFADAAATARKASGKDTGTVRLIDGDFVIVADLPKKIGWDQAGLRQVESQLAAMGEPVDDYILVKRDVPERAYEAWPASLKKLFQPYRTVDVGKAGFKLERKKEAA